MPLSLRTHEYKTVKGRAILTGVKPYVRLSAFDGPPVYVQGGHFFAEGGKQIQEDQLPEWIWDEIEKMSEQARQEVGLSKKGDQNLIKAGAAKK